MAAAAGTTIEGTRYVDRLTEAVDVFLTILLIERISIHISTSIGNS
jgi:hypothetical protein